MPTKIKPDYKPGKRMFELFANRYGIREEHAREFVGHEMGAFMMYFENTGKTKDDWDSTCLRWMTRNYEHAKEQMALHRAQAPQQGNIFEQALNSINKEKPVERPTRARVVSTPIPGEGETMSADDALKVLAGMHR